LRNEKGAVGKQLYAFEALFLGVADSFRQLRIEQGLSKIVQMDIGAVVPGAFVDQLRVQAVNHRGNGPLHIRVGAYDASGVAGIGGFDLDSTREIA